MKTPPVDFSFVYELSGNDHQYIFEVISIFLASIPEKLGEFAQQITNTEDFHAIEEQAHFLKSSSAVIKIRSMYDDLARIEALAREKQGLSEIRKRLADLIANFNEAMPVLLAEQEKNKME